MIKYEDKDICSKCGGKCCLKCGCDYIPKDFKSLALNDLLSILSEGNISIVSSIVFEEVNKRKIAVPFLYLRSRNTNRDVIDLVSFKTRCSMLTETGCSYDIDNRPSGGVNLIPMPNDGCYPKEDLRNLIGEWDRYQKVLSKCVKRLTGKNVDEVFKNDIKKMFYDLLSDNVDNDVSPLELFDVKNMLPVLIESCYSEYKMAEDEYLSNNILVKR